MHNRDRAACAAIPIFSRDDRAVPAAMIELHRDLVRPMHLNAVDRGIDPAAVGIAHDDERAGADERTAVLAMPDRRRKPRDVHIGAGQVFRGTPRASTATGRSGRKSLRFSIQALSASSGRSCGIEPKRQRRALHIGRGVGEDAKAALMAFDVVEQQRRAVGQAGRDFGDAADLEAGIGAADAAQRAELVDAAR